MLVASNNGMQAVKLCHNKIFQFSTGEVAIWGDGVAGYQRLRESVMTIYCCCCCCFVKYCYVMWHYWQ